MMSMWALLFSVFEIFHNKKLFKNTKVWVQPPPTELESLAVEAQDSRGFTVVQQVNMTPSQDQDRRPNLREEASKMQSGDVAQSLRGGVSRKCKQNPKT